MANREAGERDLTIGGQNFVLKFSIGAFMELESQLGMSAGEIEQELTQGHVGFRLLHAMIWAGTRKHHRQEVRTPGQLLQLMEDAFDEGEFDFQDAFTACVEAYGAAQPKPREEDQDKPKAPKAARKAG